MTFHVGQKVVCIHHFEKTRLHLGCAVPVLGNVYTVAAATIGTNGPGIVLFEFSDHVNPLGWLASSFRPIVSRKTSIEIFTRMLAPSKQGVDA